MHYLDGVSPLGWPSTAPKGLYNMPNLYGINAQDCKHACETGFWHLTNFLTAQQQDAFAEAARSLKAVAPFVTPTMRDGTKMGVKVTSFGRRGWWADKDGYRYVERHPTTNKPFPPLPGDIWAATAHAMSAACHYSGLVDATWTAERWGIPGTSALLDHIDTCLVNFYAEGAELGWHIDQTELAREVPIVTFSIGAAADFEIELPTAGGTRVFRHTLYSGDAIVMAGPARLARHRVVKVRNVTQGSLWGSSFYNPIEASGARLSFTVRRTGL